MIGIVPTRTMLVLSPLKSGTQGLSYNHQGQIIVYRAQPKVSSVLLSYYQHKEVAFTKPCNCLYQRELHCGTDTTTTWSTVLQSLTCFAVIAVANPIIRGKYLDPKRLQTTSHNARHSKPFSLGIIAIINHKSSNIHFNNRQHENKTFSCDTQLYRPA